MEWYCWCGAVDLVPDMVQVTFTLNDIHDSFTLVFQQLPDNYPKQRTVTYASNARLTASCTLESITWAKNKQTNKQTNKKRNPAYSWWIWSSQTTNQKALLYCFNHWVVTLVADKLKSQWLCEIYFRLYSNLSPNMYFTTDNPQNICERLAIQLHFKNMMLLLWFSPVVPFDTCVP